MDLQELMKKKGADMDVLEKELRKVDAYRLEIMSQQLKTTGQIELLRQMILDQQKEKNKEKGALTAENANIVTIDPKDTKLEENKSK